MMNWQGYGRKVSLPNTDKTVQQPSQCTMIRPIFKPGIFQMPLHQTAALWTDGRTCIECAGGRESYRCKSAKFSEHDVGEFVWTLGLC